jgi:uncharacterized membrane protein
METTTTQNTGFKIKNEIVLWLILLLPFAYIPFIWDNLPEEIPIHWNLQGEVDNYGSRTFGTLFLPVLNIAMYLLFLVIPRIDPRRKNFDYFGNTYRNIRIVLAVFMMAMFFLTMQWALGNKIFDGKTISIFVFALLAVFGNFMRTIRSNYFVGIRTPWTLDNAEVWRRTHEVGGRLWFYASLAAILFSFILPKDAMIIFQAVYLGVIIVYPILYSYLLFRKIGKAKEE